MILLRDHSRDFKSIRTHTKFFENSIMQYSKHTPLKLQYVLYILTVPLVDSDVHFSVLKLFQLHRYGVNLIEALSRDRYRFHMTAGVQLLKKTDKELLHSTQHVMLNWSSRLGREASSRPTHPLGRVCSLS